MQVDDPGERQDRDGPVDAQERRRFGYVGPVWYWGAWEVLARFEAAKSQARCGAGERGRCGPATGKRVPDREEVRDGARRNRGRRGGNAAPNDRRGGTSHRRPRRWAWGRRGRHRVTTARPTAAYPGISGRTSAAFRKREAFFATIGYDAALAVADGQAALVQCVRGIERRGGAW